MGKHRDAVLVIGQNADWILKAAIDAGGALNCVPRDLVDWAFETAECAARKGADMLAQADAKDAEEKAGE